MIQNYEYFLALAETLNISHAAQKLYISHQCLSRYLKNLEDECGLTLFERKPNFTLTYAGQVLYDSLREIQRIEQNTHQELAELKTGNSGVIRLGVTEGRLRIFLPQLLKAYRKMYPEVVVRAIAAPTRQMQSMLSENKLDIVFGGYTGKLLPNLEYTTVMEESLYAVLSDNLLKQYFPEEYPDCLEDFMENGIDFSRCQQIPFCCANKGYNSRTMMDTFLTRNSYTMNIVYEANQPDFLHALTASDYAASLCLSMYTENIRNMNKAGDPTNQLRVFPIRGLTEKDPMFVITQKGKFFPQYTKAMIKLIRSQCNKMDIC